MPASRILRMSDARIRPWKNGRGETAEILVLPEGADFLRGDFDVRISRAAVIEDGPFSNFAGFDRVLVVVSGNGIVLDHGDDLGRHSLLRHSPYRFSGDAATTGRLIDGPIEDFNVITRRGRARADVRVVDGTSRRITSAADRIFLHVMSGEFGIEAASLDGSGRLSPGDSFELESPSPTTDVVISAEAASARALVVEVFVGAD